MTWEEVGALSPAEIADLFAAKDRQIDRLTDQLRSARARRRLQAEPPFTVFTLLFWIAVGCVSSAVIVFGALYALGLLEFRR